MLKFIYDLNCGFEDCCIKFENQEFDITHAVELLGCSEEGFYSEFKDTPEALVKFLENCGYMEIIYESSVLELAHSVFKEYLEDEKVIPNIWEPHNIRLVLI